VEGKVHTTTKSPSRRREEPKEATKSWEPPRLLSREQADQWPSLPNCSSKPSNSSASGSGRRHEFADEFMPEEDPPPFASILLAPEKQAMPSLIWRTGVGCEEENY
jgi:hypothetical protein